jgi:hypothetical protein
MGGNREILLKRGVWSIYLNAVEDIDFISRIGFDVYVQYSHLMIYTLTIILGETEKADIQHELNYTYENIEIISIK